MHLPRLAHIFNPSTTTTTTTTTATILLLSSCLLLNSVSPSSATNTQPGTAPTLHARDDREAYFDKNRDNSSFLWLLEDDYSGPDFFDHFLFFTSPDPTNGMVRYVPREEAFARRLAYVEDDGTVVMKADDTTHLPMGEFRSSVRIQTAKHYTTGLFILDLKKAPWGCGVWPAWWSTHADWPTNGEIDIIEGVHDNEHNQIAWHTADGCNYDTTETFSGNVTIKGGVPATNCYAMINDNAGCSVTEWSRASYGPYFDDQGGGLFAMKWDSNGIAVWSFYRAAIPEDITRGTPNPSTWGPPSALLGPERCEIEKYFRNHTIILNITFCGDWAGNSYATTTCPGTCPERLMNPENFVNATWNINSMKVYKKTPVLALVVDPDSGATSVGGWAAKSYLVTLGIVSVGLAFLLS